MNYGVEFPVLAKVDVNGDNASPVFEFLKNKKTDFFFKRVKWNFEKFLVSADGEVVGRWDSTKTPTGTDVRGAIEKELAKIKVAAPQAEEVPKAEIKTDEVAKSEL